MARKGARPALTGFQMDFANKVIIVTGGAFGIGQATTREFVARSGASALRQRRGAQAGRGNCTSNSSRVIRSVVEPASENPDLVFLYLIDESMFLIDASRPTAGQFVFQGLWLARAGVRVPLNFANQPHDSRRLGPVFFDPPSEILEGRRVKFQVSQLQHRARALPGVASRPAGVVSSSGT
jgi:hypothetical protein